MAKIRGKKEGSIHQRKNGTWRAQVSLEGRRLSFTAKTRRECHEWLKQTIGHIDHGMTYSSTKITLEEYMDLWLTSIKSSHRPSTWSHYEQLTRIYVLPHLGQIRIKDLHPELVQRFYNRLFSNDISAYTISKIHIMLHSALGQAVKTGMAIRNAADATIPPRAPAREMRILDESQVSQLLITARGSRMEALLHLAVSTGMRQMEILGLRWNDLDWLKRTLKVERQLVRQDGVGFAPPKTKYGRRTVALGEKAIEVLRRHADLQNLERKKAGERWTEYGLIFTSATGTPIHYRNLLRDFKYLLSAAGLPDIRFHDLRHTAASLMLNHGIPVIVVSRRLGHAKPSITLDIYGHLLPGMQEEAAELMDELITPVPVQQLHPTAPDLHSI